MDISVLMSVYNEPVHQVERAVESVLKQSYGCFEFIIIVDNPANTELISYLEDKKESDTRIKVFVNSTNVGLTKSLNIGLNHCTGKYIARMDADDVSLPQRFEKQFFYLESHPDIVACGSFFKLIDDTDREIGKVQLETSSESIFHNLLFQTPFCHPATMLLRIIDGKSIHYNEELRYSQDYGLWSSLGLCHNFANIPEYLFCYRVSSNQISFKNREEQQRCHISVQRQLISDLGLVLSELDERIIINLLNQRERLFSCSEIEGAILRFVNNNVSNTRISTIHNKEVLLLNYANYLPIHFSVMKSFYRTCILSFQLKHFSYKSFISLANKSWLKLKQVFTNE